jgi:RecB family endonuclease NucS
MRPQYEASLAEQTALLQEAIEYNRRRGDIHQASLLKRELEKLPETLAKSLGVKPKPMETANG